MFISMEECVRLAGRKTFRGVIHIGAHHGEEVRSYFANRVERVIWVEANPNMLKHLFDATSIYTSPAFKQEYVSRCLSDKTGEKISFNIANNGQSSSILDLGKHKDLYPHIQYTQTLDLVTERFEDLAKGMPGWNQKDYDFVNIDVQGAELKVLRGFGEELLFGKDSTIRAIYSEVNTEEIYVDCAKIEELDEFLARGSFFRIATRMEPGAGWGDALWLRT